MDYMRSARDPRDGGSLYGHGRTGPDIRVAIRSRRRGFHIIAGSSEEDRRPPPCGYGLMHYAAQHEDFEKGIRQPTDADGAKS